MVRKVKPAQLWLLWLLVSVGVSSRLMAQETESSTGPTLEALMKRLDNLERENMELRGMVEQRPATPPSVGDEALREEIRTLQERLRILEGNTLGEDRGGNDPPLFGKPGDFETYIDKQVDKKLKAEATKKSEKDKAETSRKEAEAKAKEAEGFEVGKNMKMTAVWNNGINFATEDDAFRFHLGGRVDWDTAFYNESPNLKLGSDNTIRLHDGTDFRRMRLRADGRIWDFADFVFEVNFANLQDFSNQSSQVITGSVGVTDVNLIFRDVPLVGNVRVGHFLPPISLEHTTSSNTVYYMERSPQFDAFINRFDYVSGLNFFDSYLDNRATFGSAIFRSGSATINPFGAGNGDGEYGWATRGTLLPIFKNEGRQLLHLGMSVMQRSLDNNATSPGDRPLVRGGASKSEIPNVMQTGTIYGPFGQYYLNPELAMVYGRWSMSAEYLYTFLPVTYGKQNAAGQYSDPRGFTDYTGYYVETGYFLTKGDYRRYDQRIGAFGRTVPFENGWLMRGKNKQISFGRGAVQLLARYTYLDLTGGKPIFTRTAGAGAGVENDLTLGVAWYMTPQSNVQLNYIHTNIMSVLPGASGNFDALGIRFHYDF